MEQADYKQINKDLWNLKVPIHLKSDFYGQKEFEAGKTSLKGIELALLGEIKGKDVLHLQCHFGQDSISMARMGANVTGVDLSDEAIKVAKQLSQDLNVPAEFICSDVYDAPTHIDKKFDIVFSTYGTIGWLPDMERWSKLVKHFLKPGGRLILVEFHPFVWTMDDNFEKIRYYYFNREEITEVEEGTYADRYAEIKYASISWNHDFGEVLGSLLKEGLTITNFQEYDYSPYVCFSNLVKLEEDKYQVKGIEGKIPMVYSLVCQL